MLKNTEITFLYTSTVNVMGFFPPFLRAATLLPPNTTFSFAEPRTMSGIKQGHVGTGEYIFLHKNTHPEFAFNNGGGGGGVKGGGQRAK